jgi:hypothetical protein
MPLGRTNGTGRLPRRTQLLGARHNVILLRCLETGIAQERVERGSPAAEGTDGNLPTARQNSRHYV